MEWSDYINESLNKIDTKPEEELLLKSERDQARHIINELGYDFTPSRVQSLIAAPASCFSIVTIYSVYGPAGVIRLLKLKNIKGV